jgi:2',3'-cyclic-nucleotide 2'-phosphodiesterase (5'-nucleotidase family)
MVGGGPPKGALLRDEPVIRVLNGLGFLAGTPGNHEFDRGLPELLRLTRGDEEFAGQNFPLISANIVETATGRPVFRPGLTVGIQGVPVAFVGATTVFTPALTSPGATDWLTFLDEAGAIDRQVSHLRDQGVQAVVLLLHEGGKQTSFPSGTVSPRVSEITAAVPGLKVVPAGHTHHTLNSQVKGCLVVQPAPNQFWEWPSGTLLVVAGRQVSTPVSWTLSPDERQCPCR